MVFEDVSERLQVPVDAIYLGNNIDMNRLNRLTVVSARLVLPQNSRDFVSCQADLSTQIIRRVDQAVEVAVSPFVTDVSGTLPGTLPLDEVESEISEVVDRSKRVLVLCEGLTIPKVQLALEEI